MTALAFFMAFHDGLEDLSFRRTFSMSRRRRLRGDTSESNAAAAAVLGTNFLLQLLFVALSASCDVSSVKLRRWIDFHLTRHLTHSLPPLWHRSGRLCGLRRCFHAYRQRTWRLLLMCSENSSTALDGQHCGFVFFQRVSLGHGDDCDCTDESSLTLKEALLSWRTVRQEGAGGGQ